MAGRERVERTYARAEDASPLAHPVPHRQLSGEARHAHVSTIEAARWRQTLDIQSELICRYRPDGTLTYVNQAYADQAGRRSPAELVGTSMLDLVPAHIAEWMRGHIARLCEDRDPLVHENSIHLVDGSVRYVEWTDHIIVNDDDEVVELQAVGRDVTARRLAERAVRANEARFRAAFDHAPIGMAVVDADGVMQQVNSALAMLVGVSVNELVGLALDELVADGDVHEAARAALSAGVSVVEEERPLAEGRVWAQLGLSLLDADASDEGDLGEHLLLQVIDLSERKAMEAELSQRAAADALTGLANRDALNGSLDRALAAAYASGEDVVVLFCDLDRFKVINDGVGHHLGDELLIAVADRLRAVVPADDTIARFGGDEFVVVHRGPHAATGAVAYARRIARALEEPFELSSAEVTIGATIGIAVADGGRGDPAALLRDADLAMYAAKGRGRGSVRVCDDELRSAAAARLDAQHGLRRALERDELRVHLQPIAHPREGSLAGVEALLRWEHPERGLLSAGAFLPDVEDSGVMPELGEWVLTEACRQLAWLTDEGVLGGQATVWVNVSGEELADPRLPARARAACAAAGLDHERLVLEISERALLERAGDALEVVASLGFGLALDDVGTGRSAVADLVAAPLDYAKIDRSFVRGVERDPRHRTVVDALLRLARASGARVVAEGVETEAQREVLTAIGFDLLQGYGIGRPVPVEELAASLAPSRP